MENKYREFINYLFDHEESAGDWRFELDVELGVDAPDIDGETVVLVIRRMFENYDSDMAKFSDWQLGLGLNYIFNNLFSEYSFFLRDGPASLEDRISAILSIKVIFEKCLSKRCVESLGHLSESGNELNDFCYIFWDVTPLSYCEGLEHKENILSAVMDVMEYSLTLKNIACVESGLHGLGHLHFYSKKAPRIVRAFIDSGREMDSRILDYALKAEQGRVL